MDFGKKNTSQVILTPPPTEETELGQTYRAYLTIDSIVPVTSYFRLFKALTDVKKSYPQVNVSWVRVEGNKVTFEFYDAPGVPWNLVLVAIIAALVVIGVTVLPGTIVSLLRIAKDVIEDIGNDIIEYMKENPFVLLIGLAAGGMVLFAFVTSGRRPA